MVKLVPNDDLLNRDYCCEGLSYYIIIALFQTAFLFSWSALVQIVRLAHFQSFNQDILSCKYIVNLRKLHFKISEECDIPLENTSALKRRWSSESSDSSTRLGPSPSIAATTSLPFSSLPCTTAPSSKQPRKSVPGKLISWFEYQD